MAQPGSLWAPLPFVCFLLSLFLQKKGEMEGGVGEGSGGVRGGCDPISVLKAMRSAGGPIASWI